MKVTFLELHLDDDVGLMIPQQYQYCSLRRDVKEIPYHKITNIPVYFTLCVSESFSNEKNEVKMFPSTVIGRFGRLVKLTSIFCNL